MKGMFTVYKALNNKFHPNFTLNKDEINTWIEGEKDLLMKMGNFDIKEEIQQDLAFTVKEIDGLE